MNTANLFTTPVVNVERNLGVIPSPGEILEILKAQNSLPGKLNRVDIKFRYERDDENFDALSKASQELSSFSCTSGEKGTISAVVSRVCLMRLTQLNIDILEVNVSYICH